MKLATLKDGTRDGRLVVVSRDLSRAVGASDIAPHLLAATEAWDAVEAPLRDRAAALEAGTAPGSFAFDATAAASPLPRSFQWLDGSVFVNHGRLMEQAYDLKPADYSRYPLVYQGASDDFIGPCDDVVAASEEEGIDFEGEIAAIVDEVPMLTKAEDALSHVKLLMLVNDVSFRSHVFREIGTGFGFLNAKPSTAFSPVAVTPDELGDAWRDGRVCLPLRVEWNGAWFGHLDASEMTFTFAQLIEHVTRTRRLRPGTIIGSGTVSNVDRGAGSACIAERRAIEKIDLGAPKTGFMKFGDRIRIEMRDADGHTIFGAIDQKVAPYRR